MTPEQVQQSVDSFEESSSMRKRVASMASPILIANSDLCGERTAYSFGLEWITINELPINIREGIGPFLNIGENPSVLYVETGSPADQAGLRRGDVLLAINDVSIKEDRLQMRRESRKKRVRPYRKYLAQILAQTNEDGTPVRLSYRRGGVEYVVELQPQERCDVHVTVVEDSSKTLSSKGGTIYLSRGLIECAQSDAEVQALVAHQLAHFISGHDTKKQPGSIPGGILGRWAHLGVVAHPALAGIVVPVLDGKPEVGTKVMAASIVILIAGAIARGKPDSRVTTAGNDREADYLSTYLLARAGVDVEEAMYVWNRLSTELGIAQELRASKARLKAIEKAIEEMDTKRDTNEPLIPNPNRRVSESHD